MSDLATLIAAASPYLRLDAAALATHLNRPRQFSQTVATLEPKDLERVALEQKLRAALDFVSVPTPIPDGTMAELMERTWTAEELAVVSKLQFLYTRLVTVHGLTDADFQSTDFAASHRAGTAVEVTALPSLAQEHLGRDVIAEEVREHLATLTPEPA